MSKKLWQPGRRRAEASLVGQFMRKLGQGLKDGELDYDEFWKYSVEQPEAFWRNTWNFCELIGDPGPRTVAWAADQKDVRFFPDARLNFAENLLCQTGPEPAVIFHGEDGSRREYSHDKLRSEVSRLQQALISDGVVAGDRVGAILPNSPDAVIAMLATASIGAVWSSCSPDFGVQGVVDRFGQIEPSILFCSDGYSYNGKWYDTLEDAKAIARRLPGLKRMVVCPYGGPRTQLDEEAGEVISARTYMAGHNESAPFFARLPFSAPLFIMFSSGTTGLPKCIVHSAGGTLIQHAKELRLHCDLKAGDRLSYFTTTGWMMWNWLVSGLAARATLVIYDGSPFYPDGNRLPDMVQKEQVTHFGSSAKYFDACAKAGIAPARTHDLSRIRAIFSTGSPLSPEGFSYVYASWKQDMQLATIAGGTDIIGCFVGGSPISPVYAGQCQKRLLGMDVRVFDDEQNELQEEPGELVCLAAHPSMPTGFYNDPDRMKYTSAYFRRFPGVWHHGDWVELTAEQGLVYYGRSDATLNPSGVRIGTAEIYRPVERLDEVVESLAIGRREGSDVSIVLFVKLREGLRLDDELSARMRSEIRRSASPRHVPAHIIAVSDIPRTKSGKIVELAVSNVVHGRPVGNVHALANPEALDLYRDLPELQ